MTQSGIIEVDLHGMNAYQAQIALDAKLRQAKASTYRIRVIHGYRGGTELQKLIRQTYAKHPKVRRIELGLNPGQTDLVLREF